MGTWLNSDGLYIKYGTSEGVSAMSAGSPMSYGAVQCAEIVIDLDELTESETIQNDVTTIPDNALIQSIEVTTLVAAATGTAIDFGLVHISRDTADAEFTADPDGLLAAFITATMSEVGEYTLLTAVSGSAIPTGTTTMGTLVGEVTTAPCLFTCSRTTATAFTAGRILVRVNYIPTALTGFGVST